MMFLPYVGFRGLASFYNTSVNLTFSDHVTPPHERPRRAIGALLIKFLPTIVNTLQCYGKERKLKKCIYKQAGSIFGGLFRATSPDAAFTVNNVAGVSCTGMYCLFPLLLKMLNLKAIMHFLHTKFPHSLLCKSLVK